MNEIDAWLACDNTGSQRYYCMGKPTLVSGLWFPLGGSVFLCLTQGHDVPPGQCRPVRLRVEVVKDG